MIEISKDTTRVYFNYLGPKVVKITIEAMKVNDVRESKIYSVKAYDYYEPGNFFSSEQFHQLNNNFVNFRVV